MKDQWRAPDQSKRIELPKPETVRLAGSITGIETEVVLIGSPADVYRKRGVQDCSAGQRERKIVISFDEENESNEV